MVSATAASPILPAWPGMGFMFLEAVNRSDIPLITAYIMFVGFLFVVVNTLVDLLYGVINPMVDLVGRRQ